MLLFWWMCGLVLRFSSGGKYACGDIIPEGMTKEDWVTEISESEDTLFQVSTGKFMLIFYYASMVAIIFSCFGSCLYGAWLCCCRPKASETTKEKEPEVGSLDFANLSRR